MIADFQIDLFIYKNNHRHLCYSTISIWLFLFEWIFFLLNNSFQDSENDKPNFEKEFNNNCFDQLKQPSGAIVASENVNSGPIKKIGKSRIQNLRASQLLQKSQEVNNSFIYSIQFFNKKKINWLTCLNHQLFKV